MSTGADSGRAPDGMAVEEITLGDQALGPQIQACLDVKGGRGCGGLGVAGSPAVREQ